MTQESVDSQRMTNGDAVCTTMETVLNRKFRVRQPPLPTATSRVYGFDCKLCLLNRIGRSSPAGPLLTSPSQVLFASWQGRHRREQADLRPSRCMGLVG